MSAPAPTTPSFGRRASIVLATIVAVGALLAGCELPGAVLQGRLLDQATGQPAAGAAVVVYDAVTEVVVAETTTGSTGWYHFFPAALPDGTYRIRFATDDWWQDATTWAEATDVAASAASHTIVHATVDLATGSITGTVTAGTGPIAGALVEARSTTSGAFVASTTTGPAGTYTFAAIATGAYQLRASAAGHATTYLGGTSAASGATVVQVDEDASSSADPLVLPAESTITGTVLADALPAAGIQVIARQAGTDEPVTAATTGADGHFTIGGLPPATYELTLLGPAGAVPVNDGADSAVYAVGRGRSAGAGTIELISGVATPTGHRDVAAGSDISCALDDGGALTCWGLSQDGQAQAPDGTFVDVAVEMNHGCAVGLDGQLACWGSSSVGHSPVPAGSFVEVGVNGSSSCALAVDGAISCWGSGGPFGPAGEFSELFGGHAGYCALMVDGLPECWAGLATPATGPLVDIAVGHQHACGLRVDATVVCWGSAPNGATTPPPGTFTAVAAGSSFSCATAADGTVTCWGSSMPIPTGSFAAIDAGRTHACGWRTDGTVACWGNDWRGAASPPMGSYTDVYLGDSGDVCARRIDETLRCYGYWFATPVFPTPSGPVLDIGIADDYACAIRGDGSPLCWGYGTAAQMNPPSGTYTAIDTSDEHSCAIASDQTVACWGSNSSGQSSPPPGAFLEVGTGRYHSCAIALDQSIACWGSNADGRASPPPGSFHSLSVGTGHACAIALDQSVDCWGSDSAGQAAPPTGHFTSVATDYAHSCGLTVDGSVMCWGTGDTVDQSPPPGDDFTALSTGVGGTTCAVRADGSYRCWGYLGVSGWLH